jgi:rubredoxin
MMYMCIPCGYLFDEEQMQQTWSELADDWVCPECGGGREHFAEFSMQTAAIDIDQEAAPNAFDI